MTAAATVAAPSRLKKSPKTRQRRPWKPAARDHYIYRMVRFDGLTQEEAANRQRVSQATVSRILDRYERWQAHADPREGGRLDAAERVRAQRWLTYERNELILGSALRIAREVEGKTDLTKYVRTEPSSPYAADKGQIRDESTTIDRTGTVARFLRLAFRVNMEQLALVEKESPAIPEDLSPEELATEALRDAAADEELDAVERLLAEEQEQSWQEHIAQRAEREEEQAQAEAALFAGTKPGPGEAGTDTAPASADDPSPALEDQVAARREQVCSRLKDPAAASLLKLHKMHSSDGENIAINDDVPYTCAAESGLEKIAADECIHPPQSRSCLATTNG
jgi:transposase